MAVAFTTTFTLAITSIMPSVRDAKATKRASKGSCFVVPTSFESGLRRSVARCEGHADTAASART
jgi:hypothetical protein